MFGDLFGNIDQKKDEIATRLQGVTLETLSEDGAVKVQIRGTGELINIDLSPATQQWSREQLEDVLVVTINKAIAQSNDQRTVAAQQIMEEMIPPGLSHLKDIFKK